MDVLQIIKNDHARIRLGISLAESSKKITTTRKIVKNLEEILKFHLKAEADYIYPEVLSTSDLAQRNVDKAIGDQKQVKKLMTVLAKLVDAKPQTAQEKIKTAAAQLLAKVDGHFLNEEENMMPRLRDSITTDDREDLGQLIEDLKTDDGIFELELALDDAIGSNTTAIREADLTVAT